MKDGRGELSAFDIACVVIGGIVGVGIFFTPQRVAFEVDGVGMVLLAWGLGGLLAVLGAIVFAELSIHVPGHGGVFRYLDRAFGRTLAFVYGWSNWLVIQAGAAPIVDDAREERMRVGCGSATIGMFAKQWYGHTDEVKNGKAHI